MMNSRRPLVATLFFSMILMTISQNPKAADVRVTDSEGKTFTIKDAHTINYQPEGSTGGAGSQVEGIKARADRGNVTILWKDIKSITVSHRDKAKVLTVDGEEQSVTFGLQSVTGEVDGKEFSLNLERVKTLEVINP